jgi:hypothetical protein
MACLPRSPGDDILLNMNAAQVTAYLALQDEVKKLRKNRSNRNKKSKRSNRKSEEDTTSEDESERPKKKLATFSQRPDYYCWCHETQKTHSSPECKVMAWPPRPTNSHRQCGNQRNQLHHQGAAPICMDGKFEVQGRGLLRRHLPPPHPRS